MDVKVGLHTTWLVILLDLHDNTVDPQAAWVIRGGQLEYLEAYSEL